MTSSLGRGMGRLPHLPALDGIRALAVLAVLLYHGDVIWTPGGFLGVEVFFVLSGFLITALLRQGMAERGRLGLRRFWVRRARRLLPALFTMLFVVTAAFVIWWPEDVGGMRGEVPAAVGYVSNWYQIGADQSYFETLGRPSPFQHLWSLGIEEQFYIVWPLLLAGLGMFLRWPRRIAAAIGVAALASSVGMWLLSSVEDPTRIYFGTDTRAAGLLLGAGLAILWRPYVYSDHELRATPRALDIGAVLAGGYLVWAFMRYDEFEVFTYRPGIHLVALATVVLVGVAVHPLARLARALAWRPMRVLGERSYSIYLWHWPVFVVTRPGVDLDITVGQAFALRAAITLVVAEVSFRYVERPIREGALGRLMQRLRQGLRAPASRRRVGYGLAGSATAAVLALGLLTSAVVGAPERASALPLGATTDLGVALQGLVEVEQLKLPPAEPPPPSPTPSKAGRERRAVARDGRAVGGAASAQVIAVGDSVLRGATSALGTFIKDVYINAHVAWQVGDGLDVIRLIRSRDRMRDRAIVVHLGNNGRFTGDQFDALVRLTSPASRVVVVTVKVPRRWESAVNKTLRAGAERHERVTLVDWNKQWRGCKGKVFASDGFHVTPAGARCYAKMIAVALRG